MSKHCNNFLYPRYKISVSRGQLCQANKFVNFYHLSSCYCLDIEMNSCTLVTFVSKWDNPFTSKVMAILCAVYYTFLILKSAEFGN